MDNIRNICRENLSSVTLYMKFSIKHAIRPILGTLTFFCLLPAALHCCTAPPEPLLPAPATVKTKVSLQQKLTEIEPMDIFIFNNDIFQKLDCYQRFDDMNEWNGTIISGCGEKIMTAIANSPYKKEDWLQLRSRSHLKSFSIRLEDEKETDPVMTGEVPVSPDKDRFNHSNLRLVPLSSEVILNSICCDFNGRPYAGEVLSDVMVYLTNVNAESPVLEDEVRNPVRIINAGGLCEEDVEEFACRDLIIRQIKEDIGKRTIYPDIRLRCYKNDLAENSPGAPFTRLVIQGTLAGTTYYWPIDINREEGGCGVSGGHRYTYDIMITRKGSLDPDRPVRTKDIVLRQNVTEWTEKERYEVLF